MMARLSSYTEKKCANCGTLIGYDDGPPDGWQLEDGRTVCDRCCSRELGRAIVVANALAFTNGIDKLRG